MAGRSSEEKPRDMGYCFSDASSAGNLVSHLHGFEPSPEIYNLAAGVDMIGFQPKNHHLHQPPESASSLWKGTFFSKSDNGAAAAAPSSSMEINEQASSEFYHHEFHKKHDLITSISGTTNDALMVSPDSSSGWNHHQNGRLIVDDPSLRCVFTCEGNERPSQGLSLSLNFSNPSSIGLQPFELRQQHDDLRFGPSSSRSVNFEQPPPQILHGYNHVRNSKYLAPAQELLNEFCNLGINQNDNIPRLKKSVVESEEEEGAGKKQPLFSLDLLELQRRKGKLLQMLDEVYRRYKHYCDQMKGVRSSFEAVAGVGAASVYSALAWKAMSRHFRCLRDGIVREIKATKKAMGEKDVSAPGSVKGETPRLRVLDQTLRQQKALQQMSLLESHPWRPQRGLPERSVSVLRAWLFEHFLHPYPSDVDKHILARQTGLSRSQVSNWFINARVRLWKPMVEEMYLEEQKENNAAAGFNENGGGGEDEKPRHEELVRMDSECLSSIISNNTDKSEAKKKSKTLLHHEQQTFARIGESYGGGAMELDFSSYAPHHSSSGGGVSLTLGLHQHEEAGGGVRLAFSSSTPPPPTTTQQQSAMYYGRDEINQYSLLESESQSLQYRNLMGAQLLHDLAG